MTGDCSDPLRFLPVGLDVRQKGCLVIGGGSVGTRKVQTLKRAGAIVTVVSPALAEELAELIEAEQIEGGQIRRVKDSFREEHLDGAFLVVAATDDESLNAAVVRLAVQSGALACDASSAERSQLIFGALLQRDDVTVAVFTAGRDPALSRQTRDRIAELMAADPKSRPQP